MKIWKWQNRFSVGAILVSVGSAQTGDTNGTAAGGAPADNSTATGNQNNNGNGQQQANSNQQPVILTSEYLRYCQ